MKSGPLLWKIKSVLAKFLVRQLLLSFIFSRFGINTKAKKCRIDEHAGVVLSNVWASLRFYHSEFFPVAKRPQFLRYLHLHQQHLVIMAISPSKFLSSFSTLLWTVSSFQPTSRRPGSRRRRIYLPYLVSSLPEQMFCKNRTGKQRRWWR